MPKFSVEIWGMLILENNKALEPASSRGGMGGGEGNLTQDWLLKFMLVFVSVKHLSSYDNMFETET